MSHDHTSIIMVFESLSTFQRNGAIAVSVISLLSEFALVFVAFRAIQLFAMAFLDPNDRSLRPPGMLLFFRTQLGYHAACLILSNMFISSAGLINFTWVSHSGLSPGSVCSAQAVLMQIGIWSSSWFTAAHAVQTLISLVFRIRPASWRTIIAIFAGWLIAFVSALAPLLKSNVYGPAGSSCGLALFHTTEAFALGAFPIIFSAFASIAVYSVASMILSGKLRASGTQESQNSRPNHRRQDEFEGHHASTGTIVRAMLWYPLAYVLLLLPFCIKHIISSAGYSVPPALGPFADVCASMLGLANVGLLFNTMRVIRSVCPGSAADAEKSFGNDASGESPVDPNPRSPTSPALPAFKSSHLTFIPAKRLSHALTTVNTHRELILGKKATYEFGKAKVAPLVSHNIIPPAELNRQLERPIRIKRDVQSEEFVDLPLQTAAPPPCPPHLAFLTRDEPRVQNEQLGSQTLVHTNTFGIKVPTQKHRGPPTLETLHFPGVPCRNDANASSASSSSRASTDCDSDGSDIGEIVYAYKASSESPSVQSSASAAARHMSRMTVWSQASAGHGTNYTSDSPLARSRSSVSRPDL